MFGCSLVFSPHSDDLAEQLYHASEHGVDTLVLELLARGADPNHNEFYNRVHFGFTPLIVACQYNHPLTAEHLLRWGAAVDKRTTVSKNTAFHFACYHNRMECVRVLMTHNSPTGELGCVYNMCI